MNIGVRHRDLPLDRLVRDAQTRERSREYRARRWPGMVGVVASSTTLVLLVRGLIGSTPLLWWWAVMLAGALTILLAHGSWAWHHVDRDGLPLAAQGAHVFTGVGWGSSLWITHDAAPGLAAPQWMAMTIMIAVTGGASAGMAGANTLGRNLIVAMWLVGLPALLADGGLVIAAAVMVFLFIVLSEVRASRASWENLVRLETQARHEASVRHRASLQDELTGLANRRGLDEHVAADRGGSVGRGVIFLDLDGFKAVNDDWGHRAGDAVLVEVARRLADVSPSGSIVARPGGDEFVVVLDVAGPDELDDACLRMSTAIERPIVLSDHQAIEVGVSVGAAFDATGSADLASLLDRADEAQYRVKRSNRTVTLTGGRPPMTSAHLWRSPGRSVTPLR